MSGQAERFYEESNPKSKDEIVAMLDAYGTKKANEVRLSVKVLLNSIEITTTLGNKIGLEERLRTELKQK